MNDRSAAISRETGETNIRVSLNLDLSGPPSIETGVGFLDHMLTLLAHHSGISLQVEAAGDLTVDDHHTVEDVGLVLGEALAEALGDKAGINRYGSAMLPMDEVLVAAAVDLSGRALFASNYEPLRERVGTLSTEMVNHFFASLAARARMTLHVRLIEPGINEHHRIEAIFKAFARALRGAIDRTPGGGTAVPSTKGVL
jgi:imidazoleglycerol-phosphate dehydratase